MKSLLIATVATLGLLGSSADAGDFGFSLRIGKGRSITFGGSDRYRGRRFVETRVAPKPVPAVRKNSAFGAREHLDEFALKLARQARSVCWEMYHHYRHAPGFRATYLEMYTLMKDAEHVHDLAHEDVFHAHRGRGANETHIAHDLHEMDELFHHIEDDVAGWSRGYRGHGHGSRLHAKLDAVGETLHHLMEDYGVESQIGGEVPAPGPIIPPRP